jgi:hypothetical protein
MKKTIFIFFLLCSFSVFGQNDQYLIMHKMPEWFSDVFIKKGLLNEYFLSEYVNPFYFEEDFNNDGNLDIAVAIIDIKTLKKGILIVHGKTSDCFILGAAIKFGRGRDDFKWLDVWQVYRKNVIKSGGEVPSIISLQSVALWVENSDSFSAIIYWDGKKYVWFQQGI